MRPPHLSSLGGKQGDGYGAENMSQRLCVRQNFQHDQRTPPTRRSRRTPEGPIMSQIWPSRAERAIARKVHLRGKYQARRDRDRLFDRPTPPIPGPLAQHSGQAIGPLPPSHVLPRVIGAA